jgi:PEP-CTERM motif
MGEKMKRIIILICLVALVCSPVFARSIPGAPNEVQDPWFETLDSWYTEGNYVLTENEPGLPGNYLDPGRNPQDKVFLRTIVDDYDGLWDPTLSNKEIDFSLYVHLAGDGYVKVRFDWWHDENMPEPSPDPNDPASPPPDGISPWYTLTANMVNTGQITPWIPLVPPPGDDPGFFDLFAVHEIWPIQPRWVSIEIEAGIAIGPAQGGEALITGIDFEAQCVPEPSTMLLIGGAVLALLRRKA